MKQRINPDAALVKLSQAERALAAIATVDEAAAIRDMAEAVRVYARQVKLGTSSINHATSIKLRAERRLATLVDEGQERGEITAHGGDRSKVRTPDLADLGLDKRRVDEARLIRDTYSDAEIQALKAEADAKDRELSRAELLRRARAGRRQRERAERDSSLVAPSVSDGPFQVLYADPPWRYEYPISDSRRIENQYPTMGLDAICALEVPAADDAILFLWATSPKLAESMEVVAAWGFDYRTSMVWVKDRIGPGYYARQRHEILLIAKRGELPVPPPESRPDSVIEAPRLQHSEKPEKVYEIIERMYPAASKVELFARKQRTGWAAWGNQLAAVA